MGTRWLTRVPLERMVVALVSVDGSKHLFESLTAKGIGEVVVADDPQHLVEVSRQSAADVVVYALGVDQARDASLIRILKEGSAPPRLIAIAETESDSRELARRLPTAARPDRVLVKPLPLARLLHEIEAQALGSGVDDQADADTGPLFAEVLADLWHQRRTGVLRVMAEGIQTIIYLQAGAPIFAEQGGPMEMLGRILVESGRLTEAQLAQAVEHLTRRPVENEAVQLGGILVELRFLSVDEVYRTLAAQVRHKIVGCFRHRSCHAELREGEDCLEQISSFQVSVRAVLRAGLSVTPAAQIERFLSSRLLQYPQCAEGQREIAEAFELGGREAQFLEKLDGQRSVAEVRLDSDLGQARAGQVIVALELGQALRLSPTPTKVAPKPSRRAAAPPAPPRRFGSARRDDAPEEEPPLLRSLIDKVKPGGRDR